MPILKTFYIAGPITKRERTYQYNEVGNACYFVNETENDGWGVRVSSADLPANTLTYLSANYASREEAQQALDDFMQGLDVQEIKQDRKEYDRNYEPEDDDDVEQEKLFNLK